MVNNDRQVPTAAASAWRIDAEPIGGPVFIVLRLGEGAAREALVRHLVEIGSRANTIAAERAVEGLEVDCVSVIW